MKHSYVIGSGPIGTIVASYLLENGYKVTLIDNSQVNKKSLNTFTLKKVKNVFSDNLVSWNKNKASLPASSSTIGGFSEVWGGTLDVYDYKDTKNWNLSEEDFSYFYNYIIDKIDLPLSVNRVEDFYEINSEEEYIEKVAKNIIKQFEINKKKLSKNGLNCKNATLFMKNKKIWSSRELFESLQNKFGESFNHIDNLEVIDINEKDNEVTLKTYDSSLKIKNSKVFIAAGAFSSSFLATKLANENTFTLKNSDLQVMPLIWIGKNHKEKSKESFSQIFINFNQENDFPIRTQLYILNKKLLESLNMNYLFIKLLNLLNYILKNRILLMFLYSHSSKSSSYDFQINKKKVDTLKKNKIKNNDFKFVFSKLFRSMTQTKLIPVPLSKKFNTYGSFHFGSSYKITKSTDKKNSVNLKGQIHSKSNIHFVDSTVMEDIPSGPITYSSMAIALNIVKNSIK